MQTACIMVRKLLPALSIAILAAISCPARASEATFSKDGNTVFLVALLEEGKLHQIDVAKKESKTIALAGELAGKAIAGIATGKDGELLLAAENSLWQWRPGEKEAKKLVAFPKGYQVWDISCVTLKLGDAAPRIFAMAYKDDQPALLVKLPGKSGFLPVFCRRCEPGSAPMATSQGRMFMVANHDVWETCLTEYDAEERGESEQAGVLAGCRIAPLAMMNTDLANSGAMVVRHVVPAGDRVIALCGGRHLGALVEFAPPSKPLYIGNADEEHPDLPAQIALMRKCLESAKVLYDGSPCDALCVHEAEGKPVRVFWRQDLEGDRQWMLREGDKAPEVLGKDSAE
jgi:hypothetical protein